MFVCVLLSFPWQNWLMFNKSCIVSLAITKPFQHTPTHWGLSYDIERFQFDKQNKQTNKQTSSIDRVLCNVPPTQVWTWLYNCSNCEGEKTILNFKWISNDKNNSDFEIFPHLRLKNYKITSKKSHSSWHFQQYQEIDIIFLKFLVLICWIFFDNLFSIFNSFHTIVSTLWNYFIAPQLIKGIPN